ncbi:hypothetical protein G6Z94_11630 [Vibrio aestuarianus]|uniref:hypothetical protein n=1 Tax=Vibrio aestuarianus TaxID=28171 RepID=UPI001592D9CF|nr:hypothetical protein [Vibrio aestuarianus]NGZ17989.1 hypothetical protein [Vibrio aestuarianus]
MKERREDIIIIEATRNWLQNSSNSQAEFATQMLAPNIAEQEPKDGVSYIKWHQNVTQRVSCIMTGKQPLPLKWKWAWIAALPDEISKGIETDLAALAGYLHTMPLLEGAETVKANTAEIYNGFSHLIQSSGASHDGVYDGNDDLDVANQQIDASLNLISVLVEEIRRVNLGTGATGKARQIHELDDMLGGICTQSSNEK